MRTSCSLLSTPLPDASCTSMGSAPRTVFLGRDKADAVWTVPTTVRGPGSTQTEAESLPPSGPNEGIYMWFFPRDKIPADLDQGNTYSWGQPYVTFPFYNCPSWHFNDQQLVINLDFCGDWAGSVFSRREPGLHRLRPKPRKQGGAIGSLLGDQLCEGLVLRPKAVHQLGFGSGKQNDLRHRAFDGQ